MSGKLDVLGRFCRNGFTVRICQLQEHIFQTERLQPHFRHGKAVLRQLQADIRAAVGVGRACNANLYAAVRAVRKRERAFTEQRRERATDAVLCAGDRDGQHAGALRALFQIFRRIVGDQFAVAENEDLAAYCAHFREDMAGQEHRVRLSERTDQFADLDDLLGVQTDGRLVENDDRRIARKNGGKADALAVSL